MLQATPQRFSPRIVTGAAAHKAAELCNPAHRLAQRGWFRRRRGAGMDGTVERLPFLDLQQHTPGHVRHRPCQHSGIKHPPGHDTIERQTAVQALGGAQLAGLDATAVFQNPMPDFTGPKVRYVAATGTDDLVAKAEEAVRDISTRYPDEKSLAVVHLQYAPSHFKRRGRVDPVQVALRASAVIGKHYQFAFWTKGLEYYAGVVVCPGNFMPQDLGRDLLLRLNTMFVALTRFRDELTVVYDRSCPAAKYLASE